MFDHREVVLESIRFDGEGPVTIVADGWTFCGAKRKDFYNPEAEWETLLKPGSRLRMWTRQWSMVAGFEWYGPVDERGRQVRGTPLEDVLAGVAVPSMRYGWIPVWFLGNDFQTKAAREASAQAYEDFIKTEGAAIAMFIDQGMTLEQIDEALARGHSGNTYGWALHLGISKAQNRENAEAVRRAHNAKYGQAEATGTVNPAILTVRVESDVPNSREGAD